MLTIHLHLSHHPLLRHAGAIHVLHLHVSPTRTARVQGKGQSERTSTILVIGELGDGLFSILGRSEANHTRAARAAVGLVLDFGLLDLADGLEELDQVIIAGRPGEL